MSSRLFYSQLFGILLIILLLLIAVPFYMKCIPNTLSKRVGNSLDKQGLKWVSVRAEGRDMILSGTAPTIDEHHKAVKLSNKIFGVRDIKDKISPQVIMPYTFNISLKENSLNIEGYLRTKEDKKALLRIIKDKYPNKELREQIDIGTGNPESWMELISKLILELEEIDAVSINIVDEVVSIAGKIQTEEKKDVFKASLNSFENHPYEINMHIVAMDTPIITCQKQFNTLLESKKVKFASNQSVIAKESNSLIKELAYISSLCQKANLEIVGYTDNLGDDEKNKKLSLDRAKAVLAELFQEGVALERMQVLGKGEESPIADNNTEAGRAKNRRIEFKVMIKEER